MGPADDKRIAPAHGAQAVSAVVAAFGGGSLARCSQLVGEMAGRFGTEEHFVAWTLTAAPTASSHR